VERTTKKAEPRTKNLEPKQIKVVDSVLYSHFFAQVVATGNATVTRARGIADDESAVLAECVASDRGEQGWYREMMLSSLFGAGAFLFTASQKLSTKNLEQNDTY